jgi:hypothetical protein
MKKVIFYILIFSSMAAYANFPCNYLEFSNIEKAKEITKGKGTVIAVIDWLFDIDNDELKPFYYKPKSFTNNNFNKEVKPWHGHWMTQIVHSIAPEAKIIIIEAVKNCNKEKDKNTCWKDNVNKALKYAADNGAIAVSISHYPIKNYKRRNAAINYAKEKGTLFIDIHYEGENDNVLIPSGSYKMRSLKSEINVCEYSPFGYEELKKGGKMKPDWNGEGLSNAAPIVLGIAALVKSVNPKLTGLEIKKIILDTAKDLKGKKVADALAAVKKAKSTE